VSFKLSVDIGTDASAGPLNSHRSHDEERGAYGTGVDQARGHAQRKILDNHRTPERRNAYDGTIIDTKYLSACTDSVTEMALRRTCAPRNKKSGFTSVSYGISCLRILLFSMVMCPFGEGADWVHRRATFGISSDFGAGGPAAHRSANQELGVLGGYLTGPASRDGVSQSSSVGDFPRGFSPGSSALDRSPNCRPEPCPTYHTHPPCPEHLGPPPPHVRKSPVPPSYCSTHRPGQ